MIDSETVLADVLKLRVSQEALVERLSLVARAVSTRTAVLVLGGIRLKIEAGQVEVAATDMELSLRTTLEADIDGEGEVVVPGKLLLDIVRSLPSSEVSIEQRSDESVLLIEAGSASYRLHTYSAEDFPRLPELDSVQLHPVDREALLETIGARRPLRLARREPAGADRHPRAVRAVEARDGRDRLLPARREGDAVGDAAARARGDHPGPGAPGALAHRGRRGRDPARRAREPRRLRRRRGVADDAPDRRAVPELPPAAAGAVRARARCCRAKSCSRSCAASR